MLKIRIPYVHAKSIYDIDVSFYKNEHIKYILTDLDNTLDSYKSSLPSEKVYDLKANLEKNGIELIIVSNNTEKRVSTYSKPLGIRYFYSIGKPFSKKLLNKLAQEKINKDEAIMIGDQVVTDITCANRAKIKSVLTDKLVKEDQWTTRFNRLFDKPLRKKLAKRNLLVDWRNK